MYSQSVRVTLLGTGDTTGTPTVGCTCDTCETARRRDISRTRFAVHVENERTGESLLVDFSPDFRQQFLATDVSLPDEALVTHIHFDHLDGLGNSYRLFDQIRVHAAAETDPETGESVAETIRRKYAYLCDRIDVVGHTPHETFTTCGLEVTLAPVEHPPLVSYGVAVEDPETGAKLAISGDTNYAISDRSREILHGPDLLLADGIVPANFGDKHPAGGRHFDDTGTSLTFAGKHMTREGALALGDDLDASQTRIVHVAHYYPADEAFADSLAVDGEQYLLE